MFTPYTFPDFPNAETRDETNRLRDGKITAVQYTVPSNKVAQNTNPNPYVPESTFVPYGEQVFGLGKGYDTFPQEQDINHREFRLTIDQPILYRTNLGVGRVQSRDVRIRTPAITAPTTAATFVRGNAKGDIYGT